VPYSDVEQVAVDFLELIDQAKAQKNSLWSFNPLFFISFQPVFL
jgi:hypothetical protein